VLPRHTLLRPDTAGTLNGGGGGERWQQTPGDIHGDIQEDQEEEEPFSRGGMKTLALPTESKAGIPRRCFSSRISSSPAPSSLDLNGVVEDNSLGFPSDIKTYRSGRCMSSRPLVPHSRNHHAPFTSHLGGDRELRHTQSAAHSRDRQRRGSHISLDSIDSNLGENTSEERRYELLQEEWMRSAMLTERTKTFLRDVDHFLAQHPPLQTSTSSFDTSSPPLSPQRPTTADPTVTSTKFRFQRRVEIPGDIEDTPTFFPEEEYKQRLLFLWKDMNKCRYLRVAEEKIDLSGVNTLVKDQMKLFQALKNQEPEPLV